MQFLPRSLYPPSKKDAHAICFLIHRPSCLVYFSFHVFHFFLHHFYSHSFLPFFLPSFLPSFLRRLPFFTFIWLSRLQDGLEIFLDKDWMSIRRPSPSPLLSKCKILLYQLFLLLVKFSCIFPPFFSIFPASCTSSLTPSYHNHPSRSCLLFSLFS